GRTQKGNSCIEGSKLDRGYAGRASTIQVTRSLDLVDLPHGKRAIGSKWVFRNKKDERGIMIRNKARLVAQGDTQEEGIDYDAVFAPVVRIEAIRLFLAYASFKDFVVYQMDVKSVFLYGKIEEEVYVCQPPGFKDPYFPDKVYKVEKALYGLHQAPRAWYETLSTYVLDNGFQTGKIDKTLFIKRYKEVKTASTPMETQKPLLKDEDGEEVDVHMYRSMIGLLMYLTSSRPDIMFAVCACTRYQVNPKVSHLHAVKRIFSDYAGARLDWKSTIGGCQFLRCRLISWQCKKQTVVANSTTEAEYVDASSCCGQLGDMSHHKKIYVNPSHTKKFFASMKRTGKDFSRRITPLFDTIMVQASEEVGEDSDHLTDSNQIPIADQPSTSSQPKQKQSPRGNRGRKQKLLMMRQSMRKVYPHLPMIHYPVAKSDQAIEITSLKKRVDKLEKRRKFRTTGLKRLKKVGAARRIESSNDSLGAQEDASK
ncbi:putative ribonuclease H-like domain-containing protein, partial [Tanacetum coccineum]